jgi:hypothetical protein
MSSVRRFAAVLITIVLGCACGWGQQQDKSKRPSPPGSAECQFADGKTVHIDYSRPFAKGRKIYGGVVPYDKEWRTGANEATTFVSNTDLEVGGTRVPAGSYTLFTVPSADLWMLVISKKTGEWGEPYPGKADDLARIKMKSEPLSSPVEQFTIAFDKGGPDTCTMHLDWETTRASVSVHEAK